MARGGSVDERDRWWEQAEPRRARDWGREEYDPEYERFRRAKYAAERGREPDYEEEQRYGRQRGSYGRRSDYEYNYPTGERGFEIRPDVERRYGARGQYEREGFQRAPERANEQRGQQPWGIRQGPHTGKGPKGYRRSDERIYEDAAERLMQDGSVDASDIEVFVESAVVTLAGTVDSRQAKRQAELIIENVPGVRDVQNQIKVQESRTTRESPYGQGAGTPYERQVRTGMQVVDANGNDVGQVKEVRGKDFLLNRPMARDVYVPFDAVQRVDNRVWLVIVEPRIDQMNWPEPELTPRL